MSKADKVETGAVAETEAAAKTPKVRKGTVAVNAKGVATVKLLGGGGVEVPINPELIDDFALLGFATFFKGLIAAAKSVEELEKSLEEAILKMDKGEFPVVEKVRKGKVDHLVEAVAEVNGVTVEKAAAWLAKQDRATKLAVRREPAVATVLARLAASEATEGTTVKSVFDGLADSL